MAMRFVTARTVNGRCGCRLCRGGSDVDDVTGGSMQGAHVDRAATEIPAPASVGEAVKAARSAKPLTSDELLSRALAAPRPVSEAPQPRVASPGEVPAPPDLTKRLINARKGAQ